MGNFASNNLKKLTSQASIIPDNEILSNKKKIGEASNEKETTKKKVTRTSASQKPEERLKKVIPVTLKMTIPDHSSMNQKKNKKGEK